MPEEPGLFDALVAGKEPQRRQRTAAYGSCPNCSNEKVGLVHSTDAQHLIWRDHYLITFNGTHLQCRSGAQHLCAAPAMDVTGYTTPFCPHERRT